MIEKNDLKNKYVAFLDKNCQRRIGKVIAIKGNTLTIKLTNGIKRRVYKDKIFGRQFRKKGLEEIKW